MSDLDQTSDYLKDKVNLMLLYDVVHEFNSTLDLSVILGRVMSLTIRALGAKRGSVFVIDERGEVVQHFLARQHLPPDVRESVVKTVMAKGVAGWVYRHKESAVVRNTVLDRRWHKFEDELSRIQSAVVVPLLWKGEIRGIISIEHTRVAAFGDREMELMEAIAAQAAVAIENARLLSKEIS
jgi:GAF domain-containing protein